MRVVAFLLLVLNIALVCSLEIDSCKVHRVANLSVWAPQNRIYGGQPAEEGAFPFMIFMVMYMSHGIGECSASLIHSKWVLSAAHCVFFKDLEPENTILVGGKADLVEYIKERLELHPSIPVDEEAFGVQERWAKKFFIHPGYQPDTEYHDIVLIRVNKPFNLASVKTIPLSNEKMVKPKYCTILGWGLTPGPAPNYALNYVESKLVLTVAMGCKYKYFGPFICLEPGKTGVCQGDSGSPLVCDNKVWGVSSHLSYEASSNSGNSLEEYYSEIYPDFDWINNIYNSAIGSAVISSKSVFIGVLVGFWFSKSGICSRNLVDVYKL